MRERRRPGEIRDAVVAYLVSEGGAASVTKICEGVATALGNPVAPSSVRSYLCLNEGALFDRTSRGQYILSGAVSPPLDKPVEFRSFQFGQAELLEADCFQWLRQRPERSIHAVVTDPPYGLVEYSTEQQAKLRNGHGGVWRIPPSFDGHQRSPLPRFTVLKEAELRQLELFFTAWARALFPVLVPGANVVIASNPLFSYLVAGAVARAGFERRGEIVRLVMTMRGGDRPKNAHDEFSGVSVMPRSMWEPWLLFRKPLEGRVQDNLRAWKTGGLRRISESSPFGDVILSHPTQPAERRLAPHPSLKPQAFLRQIVRAVLPLGEGIVADPFAGSGSTLAAAEAVGYRSIGMESDSNYFEVARTAIPKLASMEAMSRGQLGVNPIAT